MRNTHNWEEVEISLPGSSRRHDVLMPVLGGRRLQRQPGQRQLSEDLRRDTAGPQHSVERPGVVFRADGWRRLHQNGRHGFTEGADSMLDALPVLDHAAD